MATDFQSYMSMLQEEFPNRIGIRSLEIQIANNSGRYPLPDDDILRECQIFGFYTSDNAGSNELAPDSKRALIVPASVANAYLTLLCGSLEIVTQHPMKQLAITQYDRSILPLRSKGITCTKSYIQIANSTTTDPSGKSVMLFFVYLLND